MRTIFNILLLSATIVLPNTLQAKSFSPKLMLVGGGLKTCSSMFTKNCDDDAKFLNSLHKTNALYAIDAQKLAIISQAPFWREQRSTVKNALLTSLNKLLPDYTGQHFTKSELRNLWKKHGIKRQIRALTDPEYYQFLDILEIAVTDKQGNRRKESANLASSTHIFSKQIYQSFVQFSAQKAANPPQQPNILVVTASSRDPFEAADFYADVFNKAGANATWLPLDATLQAAWQLAKRTGNLSAACKDLPRLRQHFQGSMAREQVYPDLTAQQFQLCMHPEKLHQAIQNAQGIFINGGDQSLTVKAFKDESGNDYPVLSLIKKRIQANQLIVGGTSAGTAVMAGGNYLNNNTVMISNGRSEAALFRGAKSDQLPEEGCKRAGNCRQDLHADDLTYRSHGGLGLFPWGITDTHFSERGRQGRLAKLLADTSARWAFGVDEATALLVDWPTNTDPQSAVATPATLRVLGQGGVFIVEPTQQSQRFFTHYLTQDDTATLDTTFTTTKPTSTQQHATSTLRFDFAPWKYSLNLDSKGSLKNNDIFYRSNYHDLTMALCITNQATAIGRSQFEGQKITIKVTKPKEATSQFGVVEYRQQKQKYCSYSGYVMDVILEE